MQREGFVDGQKKVHFVTFVKFSNLGQFSLFFLTSNAFKRK